METLKKIGVMFALCITLVGTVWAYVSVIKAMDSIIPLLGLIILTGCAIPTIVKLAKYLCNVRYSECLCLEIGDEFTTDKGDDIVK